MTVRVKNLKTGLVHTVEPGHYSLDDPEHYQVLPDEVEAEPGLVGEKPKPKARRKRKE